MGELSDETAGVSPRLASPRSSTRYRCQLFYPGHALILALGHDVGGAELTSWSLVSRLTVWYACSVCIVALVSDTLFYEGLLRLGLLTVVPGAVLLIYVGNRMTQRGLQPLIQMTEMMQRTRVSSARARFRVEGLPAEFASLADSFDDMLDRLEVRCSRLSRFSADIGHELRTHLTNLRLEAEMALTHGQSTAYYREILASSLEEYNHLARVIDSLLFIARAEASETPIQREPIVVTDELRAVCEFYEPMASEKNIGIHIEPAQEIRAELDRTLFRAAVGNLISNAVTYTPKGGTVSIGAAQRNGMLRVEVADTGMGINREHLPHLFDRFYRVERPHARNSDGVGLGLNIVKVIMDLHEGSVEIDSQPGVGTRVALIFPRKSNS